MKEKKYCSYCGREMIEEIVGAELYKRPSLIHGEIYYPYSAFNENTGKRNLIKKYSCPKAKKFFSIFYHDVYCVDKIL